MRFQLLYGTGITAMGISISSVTPAWVTATTNSSVRTRLF